MYFPPFVLLQKPQYTSNCLHGITGDCQNKENLFSTHLEEKFSNLIDWGKWKKSSPSLYFLPMWFINWEVSFEINLLLKVLIFRFARIAKPRCGSIAICQAARGMRKGLNMSTTMVGFSINCAFINFLTGWYAACFLGVVNLCGCLVKHTNDKLSYLKLALPSQKDYLM